MADHYPTVDVTPAKEQNLVERLDNEWSDMDRENALSTVTYDEMETDRMLDNPHDLRGSYTDIESEGESTDSYIESSDEDIFAPLEEDLLLKDKERDLTELTGRYGNIRVIYHKSSEKPAPPAGSSSYMDNSRSCASRGGEQDTSDQK